MLGTSSPPVVSCRSGRKRKVTGRKSDEVAREDIRLDKTLPLVSNKSKIVCSGLDSECYDISNTLALYVFYFNELLKNVAYFKINAIILEVH